MVIGLMCQAYKELTHVYVSQNMMMLIIVQHGKMLLVQMPQDKYMRLVQMAF